VKPDIWFFGDFTSTVTEFIRRYPSPANAIDKGRKPTDVNVLFRTVFPQPYTHAVNMKKTFRRLSDRALLLSVKKEMKRPREANSVRVNDVKQAKTMRKRA
jgi:hypothetical protein